MAFPGLSLNLCNNSKAYFLFQNWGILLNYLLSIADQRYKAGTGYIAW